MKKEPIKIVPAVNVKGVVCATFPSMAECAKELGIQVSHISEVASGKRQRTHGFWFMKLSDMEERP